MKKHIIIFVLLCAGLLSGQTVETIKGYGKLVRISTPQMKIETSDPDVILLQMSFNGAIPKEQLSKIKVSEIQSVSLVYTQYKLSETFNQMELNVARMDELFRELPGLKGRAGVQWYWVEQTGCSSPGECNGYFHGFVIRKKSAESVTKAAVENDLLDYYVSLYSGKPETAKLDSLIKTGKIKLVKKCDTTYYKEYTRGNRVARIGGLDQDASRKLKKLLKKELGEGGIQLDLILNKKGKFVLGESENASEKNEKILALINENMRKMPAKYRGRRIDSRVDMHIFLSDNRVKISADHEPILPDTVIYDPEKFNYQEKKMCRCEYKDTSVKLPSGFTGWYVTEDVVTKVLDRHQEWNNCLVATDVTGSMSPYLAQFILWHKLHLKTGKGNHEFVFFNDGDNAPDHLKVSGDVGGIYFTHTTDYEELDKCMKKAMRNGGGGDGPENNVEAVIKGLERFPECKEVIMIADNWATPRDLSLIMQVKVPIRLILCGASARINPDYLNMIYKNGGSVHTIEQDLENLKAMKEGDKLTIGNKSYVLSDGRFSER